MEWIVAGIMTLLAIVTVTLTKLLVRERPELRDAEWDEITQHYYL